MSLADIQVPRPLSRTLIAIALDTSGSMGKPTPSGQRRIDQLNEAMPLLITELRKIPELESSGELLAIAFGVTATQPVRLVPLGTNPEATTTGFVPVNAARFEVPLAADGPDTPLGAGLTDALQRIEQRQAELAAAGIGMRYRTQLFVLSDGEPTDDSYKAVLPRLRNLENTNGFLVFAFGVHEAKEPVLRAISPQGFQVLGNVPIAEAIRLVSVSTQASFGGPQQDTSAVYTKVNEAVSRRRKFDDKIKKLKDQ